MALQAHVTLDYLGGCVRLAETVFGWGRMNVAIGLEVLRTGKTRPDVFFKRGNRMTDEKMPQLEEDFRFLAEP